MDNKKKKIIKVVVIGTIAGAIGTTLYFKGIKRGANIGFKNTIEWFDRTIPEIKLSEQFADYVAKNPGRVVWNFNSKLLNKLF